MKITRKREAYTLLELLVVMSLLVILVGAFTWKRQLVLPSKSLTKIAQEQLEVAIDYARTKAIMEQKEVRLLFAELPPIKNKCQKIAIAYKVGNAWDLNEVCFRLTPNFYAKLPENLKEKINFKTEETFETETYYCLEFTPEGGLKNKDACMLDVFFLPTHSFAFQCTI